MIIEYSDKILTQKYQLMAQTIIPRPIAWIVTQNNGVVNVAPFSYFMGLSSDPATLIVSIGHKSDATPKDTLRNIRESKRCTICMVDEPLLTQMNDSAKEFAAELSEAQELQIKTKQIADGFPPIVAQTPTAFFCTLHQEIELKGSQTIPLILEIKKQYIAESILEDKEKITLKYSPVARIGKSYAKIGETLNPN